MRVRWTTEAADDLERICDDIAESRPESARRVARPIVQGIAALETFPNRGRPGRVEGTRALVFVSLPFFAIYEVHDEVEVCRSCAGAAVATAMTKVFIASSRQLSRLNAEMKAGLTHDRERLHNPGLDLTQSQWVRGCKFGRPLGVE
jgi:toxin ParE1/3/4